MTFKCCTWFCWLRIESHVAVCSQFVSTLYTGIAKILLLLTVRRMPRTSQAKSCPWSTTSTTGARATCRATQSVPSARKLAGPLSVWLAIVASGVGLL